MTVQEIIETIRTLSLDKRLIVLEAVSRDLRETLLPRQVVLAETVRGLLADGPTLSDDECSASRIDYLLDKYS